MKERPIGRERPTFTIRERYTDGRVRTVHAVVFGTIGNHGVIVLELGPGETELDWDAISDKDYMARYNEYNYNDSDVEIMDYDPSIPVGMTALSA